MTEYVMGDEVQFEAVRDEGAIRMGDLRTIILGRAWNTDEGVGCGGPWGCGGYTTEFIESLRLGRNPE